MLFVYETPRPASFWMKDTLIPLDMLFFDAAGRLRHVHPQATPLDLTPIPGAAPGDPDPDRLIVGIRLPVLDPAVRRTGPRHGAGHRLFDGA